MTPREIVNDTSFEYSPHSILEQNTIRKPWHDYGRGGRWVYHLIFTIKVKNVITLLRERYTKFATMFCKVLR